MTTSLKFLCGCSDETPGGVESLCNIRDESSVIFPPDGQSDISRGTVLLPAIICAKD